MACFLVSTAEAVVVTATALALKKKEKAEALKIEKEAPAEIPQAEKLPWSKKLMILAHMLWGGAFLLCFEHIWHGEVVPWPPFLTAMSDPADTAEMLAEMGSIGVTMAIIVTLTWAVMMIVADRILARPDNKLPEKVPA